MKVYSCSALKKVGLKDITESLFNLINKEKNVNKNKDEKWLP